MGYKFDEHEILAAAVDAVLSDGISRLTYGRLAKRMGVSDRVIVYYFPTKSELIRLTVEQIGIGLQARLDAAIGPEKVSAEELLRRSWRAVSTPEADRSIAILFELIGLGAASISPFNALAPIIVGAWIDWLAQRIDAPTAAGRQREAAAAIASLDGLLLLRHTMGPDVADQAASELGVSSSQ